MSVVTRHTSYYMLLNATCYFLQNITFHATLPFNLGMYARMHSFLQEVCANIFLTNFKILLIFISHVNIILHSFLLCKLAHNLTQ